MPKTGAAPAAKKPDPAPARALPPGVLVVSTGCPAGIGPEISVQAGAEASRAGGRVVLVGDPGTLRAAAERVGVPPDELVVARETPRPGRLLVHAVGPEIGARDREPGHPGKRAGQAQLAYVDAGWELCHALPGAALVTGPVSKAAIARSGAPGAERFLGHTEWLGMRDGGASTVMCFAAEQLVTSLVTTHLRLADVARAITSAGVRDAILALAELVRALGQRDPLLAVCSLNPHAGEGELLGDEEARAIIPGVKEATRLLRGQARVVGPIGAETAFRKAAGGAFQGVVAQYHDQATIPMKLLAFGEAVNVTWGLSAVRTSVDHGTAYDIAWQGRADATGMRSALALAAKLLEQRRRDGARSRGRVRPTPPGPGGQAAP